MFLAWSAPWHASLLRGRGQYLGGLVGPLRPRSRERRFEGRHPVLECFQAFDERLDRTLDGLEFVERVEDEG